MRLSTAGYELIKRSEGYRRYEYLDRVGLRTIGYGHRLLSTESFPNGVEEIYAESILGRDVERAELAVLRLVTVELTQGQFDALVDFVFNLGVGRLSTSTLLRDLNAGRYDEAADQLLRWDHCGAKENAALRIRRTAEFHLWAPSLDRQAAA
jgi:lysozyme